MTEEESRQETPVDGKFQLKVIAEEYSREYAEGEIMDQNPDADTVRKSDLVINVTVSLGIHTEEMPPLNDLDRNAAEALLNSLQKTSGLSLEVVWAEPIYSEVEAGKVISTLPVEGELLEDGDTVTVVISKGPELKPVMVIPFTGMTREQAEENLKKMGLEGEFVEEANSAPPGTIFQQSIAADTQVVQGTSIVLYVSTGPLYDPEGVPPTEPEPPLPDMDASDTASTGEDTQ